MQRELRSSVPRRSPMAGEGKPAATPSEKKGMSCIL